MRAGYALERNTSKISGVILPIFVATMLITFQIVMISLLKFSALYGANASGKSNLVEAIKFSRALVLRGVPDTITLDKYSKIEPSNKEKLSQFEYEVIIDNLVYVYGFSVNLFEKKIESD